MAKRSRVFGGAVAALAFLVVCCLPSAARAAPFLSAEIEAALLARADFLQKVDLAEEDFLELKSWLASNADGQLEARISRQGVAENPWYHYIRGIIEAGRADVHYERAVAAASEDAGTLWLLALEFIRNDKLHLAANSFVAIERLILAGGGSSAPLLSMQLMLMGDRLAAQSSGRAEFCYDWAKFFDRDQPWWLYKKGLVDLPGSAVMTAPVFLAEATNVLSNSWRAQLGLLCGAYRFLSVAVFIFICAVMLAFAVKYLPSGVHAFGDVLFIGASPRVREVSSVVVVLSILTLGILPALWVIAFLTCRFLNASERKLLITVCAILAFSPLNAYVTNFLQRCADPASTAALLDRAVSEGYSEGLHRMISANVQKNPDYYTNQIALAIIASKQGDYVQSKNALNSALQLAPDDPIVLMYAGNISYLTGDTDGMIRFYGDLLSARPDKAEALYNLSLAYVDQGGFTAPDMIGEAAQINPTLIGDFMRANEDHFAGAAPPLRRVMQPVITPGYFWGRMFLANPAEIFHPAKSVIGRGVSSMALFCVFTLLFATLLILNYTIWECGSRAASKAKKYFFCRVCGRLLCRRCRKGTMCSVCCKLSLESNNSAAAMYNLQKKFQANAQLRKDFLRSALGALVPGADRLYVGGDESMAKPLALMCLASAIFAAMYCALTFRTNYPAGVVMNPAYYVSLLLIYNVTVFIKQIVWFTSMLGRRAKMTAAAV